MKRVEELEVVDDERASEIQRIWDRLNSFKSIADGWLEGDGRAPSQLAKVRAREVLGRLLVERHDIAAPSIFPTPIGGVQAEWIVGAWAADAAFDADEELIRVEASHSESGEERTAVFNKEQVSADRADALADWLVALEESAKEGHVH
jgi:hypothetical protein